MLINNLYGHYIQTCHILILHQTIFVLNVNTSISNTFLKIVFEVGLQINF